MLLLPIFVVGGKVLAARIVPDCDRLRVISKRADYNNARTTGIVPSIPNQD
jgi:hypothetical protein